MGSWSFLIILAGLSVMFSHLGLDTLQFIVFIIAALYGLLGGGGKKR